MSEMVWKEQAIQLMALLDQEKRKSAELVEAMRGIEHFSDALNSRNDHLSKALRQWIEAGASALEKFEPPTDSGESPTNPPALSE